jgi:hypothetical protein
MRRLFCTHCPHTSLSHPSQRGPMSQERGTASTVGVKADLGRDQLICSRIRCIPRGRLKEEHSPDTMYPGLSATVSVI